MFFLLDSAGAPAVRYEPCLTGGMVVGGTRTSIARRVLEALPREHPGPWIVLGFPIHEGWERNLATGKNRDGACCANIIL